MLYECINNWIIATPIENKNYIGSKSKIEEEENIDWDNVEATYDHKRPEFKHKDFSENSFSDQKGELNSSHQDKSKNLKFNKDKDIGNKNKENDKGIRGKNL